MKSDFPRNRCVFFDRDGIVNEAPASGYVLKREDFHLQPAFVDALRVVRLKGYQAAIVTNQRCVALGLISLETVEAIHAWLVEELRTEYGLDVLEIMVCPHDEGRCECRKPKPGLLIEAARKHGMDLKSSWMVGDQDRDIEAGRRAGCRTIKVGSCLSSNNADYCVEDIRELPGLLDRVLDPIVGTGCKDGEKQ